MLLFVILVGGGWKVRFGFMDGGVEIHLLMAVALVVVGFQRDCGGVLLGCAAVHLNALLSFVIAGLLERCGTSSETACHVISK